MSEIKAILFDLDDTLHPEGAFVASGHRAVAEELARLTGGDLSELFWSIRYDFMKLGRTQLFDRIAARHGLDRDLVARLIAIYRDHIPELALAGVVVNLLAALRPRYRLAIVTDGAAAVQRRKVAALGIDRLVDAVVYTWELDARKPDPAGFLKAAGDLCVKPKDAVIVGDDPAHDVEAALRGGMACIRVRAHRYAELPTRLKPPHYRETASLNEVPKLVAEISREMPGGS